MKKLATRTEAIDFSLIRAVFAAAAIIKDPLDLSIGQPDFDVPNVVKKAATAAVEANQNGYTPTAGILELRQALVQKLRTKNQIKTTVDQVMVTAGTSGGIFLALSALLNPNDEVIIFDPYFVIYKQLVEFLGAKPVLVNTAPDWQPKIEAVKRAITASTKLIIVNSPNNPTGAVYSEKLLRELVKVARQYDLFMLSDEVYEDFIYEGQHFSPGSIYEQTITVNGFSKAMAMTGWRVGYAHGPQPVIDQMIKLQQYTYVCAPSAFQRAALAALSFDNQPIIADFKQKRDLMYDGLKDKYPIIKPAGAFYLYLKTPADELTFCRQLLEKKIIVVPGSAFSGQKGFFRISYANDNLVLQQAIKLLHS